jgi:hypothetical protein
MSEQTLTITLTTQQAETILNSLAAMPYAQVVSLIAEIQKQAQEQLSPKE